MASERHCRCGRIAPPTGSCGYCIPCYSKLIKQARGRRIPVGDVRDRLHALRWHGWTVSAIESETAISAETIKQIMDTGKARAASIAEWQATAAKIFMLPLVDQPDKPMPVVGAQRRIRALMAVGHTFQEIIDRSGLKERRIREIQSADDPADTIPLYVHQRICGLYDELSMSPGESEATRGYARLRHWESPLAWDDDPESPHYIDDPRATPSGGKDEKERKRRKLAYDKARRERGEYRLIDSTEVRQHITKLRALGWLYTDISEAAGVPRETARCIHVRKTKVQRERAEAILRVPLESRGEQVDLLDVTECREHIDALRDIGWSYADIGHRSGVGGTKVRSIFTRYRRADRKHIEAILAIPLEPPSNERRKAAERDLAVVQKKIIEKHGLPTGLHDTGYKRQRAMLRGEWGCDG